MFSKQAGIITTITTIAIIRKARKAPGRAAQSPRISARWGKTCPLGDISAAQKAFATVQKDLQQ